MLLLLPCIFIGKCQRNSAEGLQQEQILADFLIINLPGCRSVMWGWDKQMFSFNYGFVVFKFSYKKGVSFFLMGICVMLIDILLIALLTPKFYLKQLSTCLLLFSKSRIWGHLSHSLYACVFMWRVRQKHLLTAVLYLKSETICCYTERVKS